MHQTTGDIAARLGGTLIGDPSAPIHGAGTLQDGQPGEIGFLSEPHYRKYLADTALTAVLLAEPCPESRATQIIVADVKRAWRELAASFAPQLPPPAISPQAHIDPTATIGTNVAIGAGAVIAGSVTFGKYCVVGGACVFTGHITICDGAQFTGHSSISKSVTEPGAYSSGIPAMPARQWKKFFVTLKLLAKDKP